MGFFKTSAEARTTLESLRRATGNRPNLWARAAFCCSLVLPDLPEDADFDSNGQEFPRDVFFGKDEIVLLALLRQRHGKHFDEESELVRTVKLHVERGVRRFAKEFERLNRRGDEFVLSLLRSTGARPRRPGESEPATPQTTASAEVRVTIGQDAKSGEVLSYSLNAPGQSPHIAVMGRTRTGKTRTGLSLLSSLNAQTRSQVKCLIFDYAKGDIAGNKDFVKQIEAHVNRVPDEVIPLAPLLLPTDNEKTIKLAARRFVDTVKAVVRIGPKQADLCLKIVKEAFARALGAELGPATNLEGVLSDEELRGVNLSDILAIAEEKYEAAGEKPDSLLAALREFCEFALFARVEEKPKQTLLDCSHVIDLSRVPEGLRRLAVFLTLDSVYARIMNEPDAPLDLKGFRQMKLIIVIDEAHNYLQCRQPTLERLIREAGSKGVSVILLSQSPDDFDQPKYNFAREMGLTVVFSCVVERPRMLEALLGGEIDPQRISQLSPGVAITRVPGAPRPTEVRVWK